MKTIPWWKDKRVKETLCKQDYGQFMQKPPEEREQIERAISEYMKEKEERRMIISKDEQVARETIEDSGYSLEDVSDYFGDLADGLCNFDAAGLLDWYREDLRRIDYLTQSAQELGDKDGLLMLQGGQYLYWHNILWKVLREMKEDSQADRIRRSRREMEELRGENK